MSGVILLFFLAIIVAFFWNKVRKRFGGSVTPKVWLSTIAFIALLIAVIYAANTH